MGVVPLSMNGKKLGKRLGWDYRSNVEIDWILDTLTFEDNALSSSVLPHLEQPLGR